MVVRMCGCQIVSPGGKACPHPPTRTCTCRQRAFVSRAHVDDCLPARSLDLAGLHRDFSQVPAGGDLLPGQGNRRRLRRPVALRPRWRLFHLPDRGLQVNSRYARLCSIAEAGFLLSASCKVEATPREVWIEDSKVSCPSRLLSWCYGARGL